tara:strand:+ start:274 stop:483 length:210 start_codon:yes stop_codon:yes gene_type:complete
MLKQINSQFWSLIFSFGAMIANCLFNIESEINFGILETIGACKRICSLKQEGENQISIKELIFLKGICG